VSSKAGIVAIVDDAPAGNVNGIKVGAIIVVKLVQREMTLNPVWSYSDGREPTDNQNLKYHCPIAADGFVYRASELKVQELMVTDIMSSATIGQPQRFTSETVIYPAAIILESQPVLVQLGPWISQSE
jgi:hypothetical protein